VCGVSCLGSEGFPQIRNARYSSCMNVLVQQPLARSMFIEDSLLSGDAPLLTGKDLFAMGDIGRAELIEGRLIRMSPTGYAHGYIEINLAGILREFVNQHHLGKVFGGEVGIYTHHNPDTVRGADVAYVSNERLAQIHSRSYLDIAPELIVEILSPDDRWDDLMDKLDEYFAIGVQMVWVADPKRQQIFIYHSVTEVERLTLNDQLTGGTVLSGFQVAVAEVFGA
jgi:Uma2 family endonuclease